MEELRRVKTKKGKKEKERTGTRQLLGIKEITGYSLKTEFHGELIYFLIRPDNLSVLSQSSLSARIYGLMTVLKGMTEIEMLCLNSRESFEDNKAFLRKRLEEEENETIRQLLKQDMQFLDRIQVQMATAREFIILVRLEQERENEVFSYLNRIEKTLKEQGFIARRAEEEDIRRILAVYFEQNVTTEKFESFDGERWVIMND